MPKSFKDAIRSLRKNTDIIITKPDKGNGVVILDRAQYTSLLKAASVADSAKFRTVSLTEPRRPGRPTKDYHPLLKKERDLHALLSATLPASTAKKLTPNGSRLAHLYGLPKTHKPELCVRPILSAKSTYNHALAKWLDCALKPLVNNEFMIHDTFDFVKEIRKLRVAPTDVLVSYDVVSLFTNVPLDETIDFLVRRAFENNWFNTKYKLCLTQSELKSLLEAATKDQLFVLDGQLYEQYDGVAMGSPLGPLMANSFMCKLEAQLCSNQQMPKFYRRYMDDTVAIFSSVTECDAFLQTLNSLHPSARFTMEPAKDEVLPFIGVNLQKQNGNISTSVHRKATNTGLLLHHHSHVDNRYSPPCYALCYYALIAFVAPGLPSMRNV